jgi:glucose-1-phosphate thymidylyltransferase
MCGLIMAGGNGTRLYPITSAINKHLIPVLDKPMIFYPLSTLMLAGIKDVCVITKDSDINQFQKLLGNGSQFGISISYLTQEYAYGIPNGLQIAEEFIAGRSVCLILGDNIFVGQGLGRTLENNLSIKGAKIFAFPVKNPSEYGVVKFSKSNDIPIEIIEKPKNQESNLAIPGLYFMDNRAVDFASTLTKSERGEYEVVDLLRVYLEMNELQIQILERGVGWMDAGTIESLYGASELIRILQERQGLRFGVPEEVSFRKGWIDREQLSCLIRKIPSSEYARYLEDICAQDL